MWFAWMIAMAEPDRPPWSTCGILSLVLVALGGCSGNLPKSLDPPPGTTESAPSPEEAIPPSEAEPSPAESAPQPVDEPTPAESAPQPVAEPTPAESAPQPAPEPDTAAVAIEVPEAPPPAPPTAVADEPEPRASESDDDTVVMIDTGAKDVTNRPPTLAEAARAERDRRDVADPTDIVITDKTLEKYATGQLTLANPSPADQAQAQQASELQKKMAEREAYWRGRALEIRQAWRDAYDQIPVLEEKVFQLRQDFFREDDGFYRDGEIKPAWDRAIEQLEEAHREVEARQKELTLFLEEGRETGALPGWLREGFDLEPQPRVREEPTAEPGEPVIYEQEATDPP